MDSFPKSLNPNKRLKEEFVSNLTGTSMLEIAAITTLIPLLFLVRRSLGFMHPSDGYWSMYLIGVQVGNFLFFSNHSSATTSRKKSTRNRAAILSLLFWLVTLVVDSHVERVSRRSCNLPCVTLVLATNLQDLAIVLVSDSLPGTKTSTIEEAYNRNLLAIFLLANFLTGLINFLVDTLFASTVKALSVMIAYAFMLTFIPGVLDFCGIHVKFW